MQYVLVERITNNSINIYIDFEVKMKKIALAGLCNYNNFGDQFIGKTLEYIIGSIDENIVCKFISFEREKEGIGYYFNTVMQKGSKYIPNKNTGHKVKYWALKNRMYNYFYEQLCDVDALIFACGSFKYGTQNLWAMYSICIECCLKLNIPVMFDAMNVQRYSQDDWRCQMLKKHANYSCVKMITSRDGLPGVNRLNDYYIFDRRIQLLPVGDPAFWIKECYDIQKKHSDVIGINLIRCDTFQNYGGKIKPVDVQMVYIDLIGKLISENISFELFTNGLEKDLELVEILKSSYSNTEIIVRVPSSDYDLVNIISQYGSILGARLHACICAYSLDIPVCGFYWDEKIKYFAEEIEFSDYFVDQEDFTGEKLFNNLLKCKNIKIDETIKEMWKQKTRDSISVFLEEFVD